MEENSIMMMGQRVPLMIFGTVIVGTGAAGYGAALCLHRRGQRDIAVVTEGVCMGTSRNTGSDKQTYYKLTLSGGEADSVWDMAQTLFDGGCMDGDNALCEAALSAESFLRLKELGVPFPQNRYGEYIGYKTDHDPRERATSVGPYTSKRMTECLQTAAQSEGIAVLDKLQVVRILTEGEEYKAVLCLNCEEDSFVIIQSKNMIYAVGGPAGIYGKSVYPAAHHGASGIAFEAGAAGQNLTEWQYGLASVNPRWNVSGTYMQALPRFISVGADGREKEFLADAFGAQGAVLDNTFLKGYGWPFNVKAAKGPSLIDLLVYRETEAGRRVFMDFRRNPGQPVLDFTQLGSEAKDYLIRNGACFGTPVQRLRHMNKPAYAFFQEHGVDLETQPLEIALCAQHNNGGLAVDCWWQTNIAGFFAAGEVAGTHGVYRPGGSALNAGQVGAARAAQYIAERRHGLPQGELSAAALAQAEACMRVGLRALSQEDTLEGLVRETAGQMDRHGGAVRNAAGICKAAAQTESLLAEFESLVHIKNSGQLSNLYRFRDNLISRLVYLEAMADYIGRGGGSRGSALYTDQTGSLPHPSLPEKFRFREETGGSGQIQQVRYHPETGCSFLWRPVRPLPREEDSFENIWKVYRNE